MELTMHQKLAEIQQKLNAPKNQHNKFGGYNYRNCEDILMAVKPLLGSLAITITDEMVMIGDRFYVKATAAITDGKERIECAAYAREAATKKGMDESQITGSTSSYARKYALNGLLLIDDNKDADAHDNREQGITKHSEPEAGINMPEILRALKSAQTVEALKGMFAQAWASANEKQKPAIKQAYDERKAQFEKEAA